MFSIYSNTCLPWEVVTDCILKGSIRRSRLMIQAHQDWLTTGKIEKGRKQDWKHQCCRQENKNHYWRWYCRTVCAPKGGKHRKIISFKLHWHWHWLTHDASRNAAHIFACWSKCKHHNYNCWYLPWCISIKPFTDVSTRSHLISVFSHLLIIKLSSGPLICLHEHLKWLLRSQSQTWSMPPTLFLSQRLSKGNNKTVTLWKTFPFVSNTY